MVLRILTLLAVLLMPLGMAPAAAAASYQPMAMDKPMGHCPDRGSHHDLKGGIAECTMACAGALPAAELPSQNPVLAASSPAQLSSAELLRGLHPDTATPPPKRS